MKTVVHIAISEFGDRGKYDTESLFSHRKFPFALSMMSGRNNRAISLSVFISLSMLWYSTKWLFIYWPTVYFHLAGGKKELSINLWLWWKHFGTICSKQSRLTEKLYNLINRAIKISQHNVTFTVKPPFTVFKYTGGKIESRVMNQSWW